MFKFKNKIRIADEFFTILIFGIPPILATFGNEFLPYYFLFVFIYFYSVYKYGNNYDPKLFKLSIVYAAGILFISIYNSSLVIGTIIFVFMWSFIINKKIKFDPSISLFIVFIVFYLLMQGTLSTYTYRSYFFLGPNFSSLFLIILQLIMFKNRKGLLFILSLFFVLSLQSRMLIIVDLLLIFIWFINIYSIKLKRLADKLLNLKFAFLFSIIATLLSALSSIDTVDGWGGYRYGIEERVMDGFEDSSNRKRVLANIYTLELLLENPTYLLTGIEFSEYQNIMRRKGVVIAHNYILSAIAIYGISGIFLLVLVYNVIKKKWIFEDKVVLLIWLLCATLLNLASIASYYGVMFLFILTISGKWNRKSQS